MSKRINIGSCDGKPFYIDLDLLLAGRAMVQAGSGGGKSWLLRLLAEQTFGKVPVWIIDPEGEFASLREKFGFVLVGKGGETPADPRSIQLVVHKLLELRASVIFDIFELKPEVRQHFVRLLLEAMIDAPKHLWQALLLILDEAHKFAPESGKAEAYSATVDMASRGRKRGFSIVPATQRLAALSKNVTANLINRLVGPTFEDVDLDRAADLLSVIRSDRPKFFEAMRVLEPGNFHAIGRAFGPHRLIVKVGNVLTTHPELGKSKYATDPPPAPDKIKELLPKLHDLPKEAEQKAKSEADLRSEIRSLKAQLAARPVTPPQKTMPISKYDERIVEVPIMGKREMNRLEKLVERVEEAKKAYWMTTTSLENATRDIAATLQRLKDGKSTNEVRKAVGLGPITITKVRTNSNPPASHTAKYLEPFSNGGKLDKCAKAILGVLAQYQEGCSIGKISLLAGYKQSGSFMSTLSSLRTQGYLIGNNSEIMTITASGVDALGDFRALPIGPDLANYWLRHPSFGACERKILAALLNSKGGLTVDEISEKTGYSQSGSFMSSLSSLRTAGVLVGKNSERMSAAEDLY